MEKLTADYWEDRYRGGYTGWDLGHASSAMRHIIDQLDDKNLKILIPGAGNGYEATYLNNRGFKNVFLLDWAAAPLEAFQKENPDFPKKQLLHQDFFLMSGSFDLILEQTFFCALNPVLRPDYVKKMSEILNKNGFIRGVLFRVPLYEDRPPFGGSAEEYRDLFEELFDILLLQDCIMSEPDRLGMEVEFSFQKRS
ncbi:MAG: methyltransferase domain-containing protein [Saprospiraceae bacterium]|nr:methyltransferase domain-containing protein [Saprospiraceae bacterium]